MADVEPHLHVDRGLGSLRPTAIERTLVLLERERQNVGDSTPIPCDARGVAI